MLRTKMTISKIRIIIYDDNDQEIGIQEQVIEGAMLDLDRIEVEEFLKSKLPEITKTLLANSQKEF